MITWASLGFVLGRIINLQEMVTDISTTVVEVDSLSGSVEDITQITGVVND